MAFAERLSVLKAQLEELKSKIAGIKSAKETEMDWDTYGRVPTEKFNFQVRRTLRGHYGKISALDWARDATTVLSASQDGKLIVWNAYTEHKKQVRSLKSPWVMTCTVEKESGNFVACGGLDNVCSIYDISPASNSVGNVALPVELIGHDGYLSCCKFLGANQMLTSSGDSSCALWDISRQKKITTFSDHSADVMSVSQHPRDLNMFASGSCDSTVKIWDIRMEKCVRTFTGHDSDVNAVEFFPSGNCVGTGSDDATCRIFDLRSCGPVNLFTEQLIIAGVTDVAFSSTGRLMFASYDECFCRAWDTIAKDGTYHELKGHKNRVSCLGVNATGQALCTGSWDTELNVWA